ncbi:MAG: tartrate dehydrogenase [Chloroflexi bacterium]|nr:tartrate dehydrogenase [Chloroflexota bacterium]
MVRTHHLAVIPGDGIGPEVMPEALAALDAVAEQDGGFRFSYREFDWGSERYLRTGALMAEDGLTVLEREGFDAILLGPVGDPRVPDHVSLWGLLLPLRQHFDQYVNLRPMRLLPGVAGPLKDKGPADIDMVCVRENTEGEYAGIGGRLRRQTPDEIAIQTIVFTRRGTERLIRFAFDYARRTGRRKVTSATKSNSMQHSMVFWDDVFRMVAADYPDIAAEQQLIDSLTARMVRSPESLDVIVASNLFGDILTDLGAAISGSMGLAPSANLNPERRQPSLFQAIHGSAPDIAGQGLANPIGEVWSAAMLLDFVGEADAARRLEGAIQQLLTDGRVRTRDLGGDATTRQLGAALRAYLR